MKTRMLCSMIALILVTFACGEAPVIQTVAPIETKTVILATTPPTVILPTQAAPQVDIDGILRRVCDISTHNNKFCGDLNVLDTSKSGWQAFVNDTVTQYYGISPGDYVRLVQVASGLPQPLYPCDGQDNLTCIQANTTPQICLPIVADGKVASPDGCGAVLVMFPFAGTHQGTTVFGAPDNRYDHYDSLLITGLSETDMRTALAAVFP